MLGRERPVVVLPDRERGFWSPPPVGGVPAINLVSGQCGFDGTVPKNLFRVVRPRNFFFLPAVMTTSGRISGDFLRLLYILSHRQAEKFFASLGILDPSPAAFKQRRGTYFHYNRSAIGLACAQAIAMRIDIARHKRPIKPARRAPAPYLLHLPMHAQHV